jgi:phosphoglycolate phosphatase
MIEAVQSHIRKAANGMKHYRTLFWDWNGTLLDDVVECIEIINKSLGKRSLRTLTLPEYLEKFEFPVKKYYENIGFDFRRESFEMVGKEYIDAYADRMFSCALQKGAVSTLKSARENGLQQYILSALNHESLQQCIEKFELDSYFTAIRGLDDSYAHSKVELGIKLLHETGCDRSSALMIGDTVHDYETASAMGISCVLVASGHNSRARLEKCGVQVFASLCELHDRMFGQA